MIQICKGSPTTTAFLFFALSLALMGCIFDTSSSGSRIGPQGGDPSELNGIWSGNYGDDNISIIFLLKEGEIYALDDNGIAYFGNYTYSNAGEFSTTLSNSNVDVQVIGTASAQNMIEATYTSSNGNNGNATLNFRPDLYNRTSAFDLLVGQWSSGRSAYSIDSAGGLSGTLGTLNGECQIAATISIIDSEKNLYLLDADLTQCQIEGQYNGLVFIADRDTVQNSRFFGAISNDQIKQCVMVSEDRQ